METKENYATKLKQPLN